MPTRYVFAFSFDRVLPAALADVNDRLHMPFKAMLVNLVGASLMFIVTNFITYVGAFLNCTTLTIVVYILGCLAGISLVFRKKELAVFLPGGRWPILIFSAIALVVNLYILYLTVTVPAIGSSMIEADIVLVATYLSGILVYVARYFHLKGKGINLSLVFKEIPPE